MPPGSRVAPHGSELDSGLVLVSCAGATPSPGCSDFSPCHFLQFSSAVPPYSTARLCVSIYCRDEFVAQKSYDSKRKYNGPTCPYHVCYGEGYQRRPCFRKVLKNKLNGFRGVG